MKISKLVMLVLLTAGPLVALADPPSPPPAAAAPTHEARFVPAVRDGQPYGVKVYAIRPSSRLAEQGFQNGDTILTVDGASVVEEAGRQALEDKVVRGTVDAQVGIERHGAKLTVATKHA